MSKGMAAAFVRMNRASIRRDLARDVARMALFAGAIAAAICAAGFVAHKAIPKIVWEVQNAGRAGH
jgi:hypothetical protein